MAEQLLCNEQVRASSALCTSKLACRLMVGQQTLNLFIFVRVEASQPHMNTYICYRCEKEKPIEDFYSNGKYRYRCCKICTKEKMRELYKRINEPTEKRFCPDCKVRELMTSWKRCVPCGVEATRARKRERMRKMSQNLSKKA